MEILSKLKIRKCNSIILAFLMTVIIVFSVFGVTGCSKSAKDYSEEDHVKRVTERIEKRFLKDSEKYTGCSVYPLYNENEELKYFLVEFEPQGFVFILLKDEQLNGLSCFGFSTSMYKLSNLYGDRTWSPYTIDETDSQSFPDTDKCWMTDEKGNVINYDRSPYHVTQNENVRKYLLRSERDSASTEYVCAVKKDGVFVNLISETEVNVSKGDLRKKQAAMYIAFIGKKQFDL